MWTAPLMRFVSNEPPYGTSMPGAGAVHHIIGGREKGERIGDISNSGKNA